MRDWMDNSRHWLPLLGGERDALLKNAEGQQAVGMRCSDAAVQSAEAAVRVNTINRPPVLARPNSFRMAQGPAQEPSLMLTDDLYDVR